MLDHAAGSGQHSYEARGQDCYETPPQAVEALRKVELIPKFVWEPACGPGAIVKVLQAHGHKVFASDIVDYGQNGVVDFIREDLFQVDGVADFGAIVTNPPYQLAEKFVRQALNFSPLVIMLLRLAFLESVRRTDVLEKSGLARIHVFRNRLPMMHRRDWSGPRASSAIPFAWFVWERGYQGPTTIDRISWESSS